MQRLQDRAGILLVDGVELVEALAEAGALVAGQVGLVGLGHAAPLADGHAADEDVLHGLLEGLALAHYGHC